MNKPSKLTEPRYQAREFAQRAGVTVRTLHHYDHLGLLKPSGRTTSGYRLYGERDLARLQQIVTLKFIGLSLSQIKDVLDRSTLDLTATLRLQRELIAEQRRRLDAVLAAIERAEQVATHPGEPDWEAFRKIIDVIEMQNDWEWVKKYYTPGQLKELAQRLWTPEMQTQVEQEWATLIKDIEAALGENPASPRAQALAARWEELIGRFTGGNPAIRESLFRLYQDQANWPANVAKKPYSEEVERFIEKASAARR